MFTSGEFVYIGVDELTHIIGATSYQGNAWETCCRRHNDLRLRRNEVALRTTPPANCLACVQRLLLKP